MFGAVSTDVFSVVADPTRRRILHELIDAERSVGELVVMLAVSQPAVSKHLKVLRDNGFVVSRTEALQRIYRLDQSPFIEIDLWLRAFKHTWNRRVDALERHLDVVDRSDEAEKIKKARGSDKMNNMLTVRDS
jgi:DNA-binding transcriptional ArsR family regulator